VGDVVACGRPGAGDAASYKEAMITVISNFAGVQQSSEVIEAARRIAV
jgi:hypothetical protein